MLLNTDSCMFVLLVAAAFKINIPRTPEISKYSSCSSVNAMLFIQCHFSCPALYLFSSLIYILLLQPQGLMHLVAFLWLNAGAFACHPSAFPPLVSCISSQGNGLELGIAKIASYLCFGQLKHSQGVFLHGTCSQ